MKSREVVEYFLNAENYILGWKLHSIKKRPDLENIIMPNIGISGNLLDIYGNPKYKYDFLNNEIVEDLQAPSESEESENILKNIKIYKIIKALIGEIDRLGMMVGGTKNDKYTILKNIVDKIQDES